MAHGVQKTKYLQEIICPKSQFECLFFRFKNPFSSLNEFFPFRFTISAHWIELIVYVQAEIATTLNTNIGVLCAVVWKFDRRCTCDIRSDKDI